MTPKRLRDLLECLDDAEKHLVLGEVAELEDPLVSAWRRASAQTADAYAVWRRRRDGDSYAVYRACADRADAAQSALATQARSGA
jgi:hypothetical protein